MTWLLVEKYMCAYTHMHTTDTYILFFFSSTKMSRTRKKSCLMNSGESHWYDVKLIYHMNWLSPWKAYSLVFGGRKIKGQSPAFTKLPVGMQGELITLPSEHWPGDDHCSKPCTQTFAFHPPNNQLGRYHSTGFPGQWWGLTSAMLRRPT